MTYRYYSSSEIHIYRDVIWLHEDPRKKRKSEVDYNIRKRIPKDPDPRKSVIPRKNHIPVYKLNSYLRQHEIHVSQIPMYKGLIIYLLLPLVDGKFSRFSANKE